MVSYPDSRHRRSYRLSVDQPHSPREQTERPNRRNKAVPLHSGTPTPRPCCFAVSTNSIGLSILDNSHAGVRKSRRVRALSEYLFLKRLRLAGSKSRQSHRKIVLQVSERQSFRAF